MTATQAVVAVAVPALAVVLILAVPGWRRRRARNRRAVQAFAWFRPVGRQRCDCCCPLDDLVSPPEPAEPVELSSPEAVAPLRAALLRADAAKPVNPLDTLVQRANAELAANDRFRAWLAGGGR